MKVFSTQQKLLYGVASKAIRRVPCSFSAESHYLEFSVKTPESTKMVLRYTHIPIVSVIIYIATINNDILVIYTILIYINSDLPYSMAFSGAFGRLPGPESR